jgi:hypothetical protein
LTENNRKAVPAGGIYYLVKDSDNCRRIPVFIDLEICTDQKAGKEVVLPNAELGEEGKPLTLAGVISNSLDFIEDYVKEIARGNFRHTFSPKDEKCTRFCSYRKICRKDTAKLLSLKEQMM